MISIICGILYIFMGIIYYLKETKFKTHYNYIAFFFTLCGVIIFITNLFNFGLSESVLLRIQTVSVLLSNGIAYYILRRIFKIIEDERVAKSVMEELEK